MAASRLPPGYATSELNRTNWEVPSRYVDINPIGNGAYGQVCSSENTDLNKRVAIKKLARPFQSVTHAKRTYRELKLLHHMKHENVINLLDVFSPCLSFDTFTDVYFVSDLMGADLNTVNKCQKLSDEHVKFLVYQILRGLKHDNGQARRQEALKNLETFSRVAVWDYIHSAGVIHRDLKPSNLAVNEDCELRILDFGLARMTDEEMTGYVATRWYRAPEIMLNWMHYSDKVDMWSVGCIMAELLTGQVLFPGTDNIDQLTKILSITGTPSEAFLTKIESDSARDYVRNMETFARKDFYHFFHGANPVAINILERMLDLDKDNRPSATEALAHEYFAQFHDPSDEPTAEPFDDEFEKMDLQLNEWKEKIFQLILEIKNGIPY